MSGSPPRDFLSFFLSLSLFRLNHICPFPDLAGPLLDGSQRRTALPSLSLSVSLQSNPMSRVSDFRSRESLLNPSESQNYREKFITIVAWVAFRYFASDRLIASPKWHRLLCNGAWVNASQNCILRSIRGDSVPGAFKLDDWTTCSPLSQFHSEHFQIFSLSYWGANSYYPRG